MVLAAPPARNSGVTAPQVLRPAAAHYRGRTGGVDVAGREGIIGWSRSKRGQQRQLAANGEVDDMNHRPVRATNNRREPNPGAYAELIVGREHLAYDPWRAVGLDTTAAVEVEDHAADAGDRETMSDTLEQAGATWQRSARIRCESSAYAPLGAASPPPLPVARTQPHRSAPAMRLRE